MELPPAGQMHPVLVLQEHLPVPDRGWYHSWWRGTMWKFLETLIFNKEDRRVVMSVDCFAHCFYEVSTAPVLKAPVRAETSLKIELCELS